MGSHILIEPSSQQFKIIENIVSFMDEADFFYVALKITPLSSQNLCFSPLLSQGGHLGSVLTHLVAMSHELPQGEGHGQEVRILFLVAMTTKQGSTEGSPYSKLWLP